jgi:hypothetical protein
VRNSFGCSSETGADVRPLAGVCGCAEDEEGEATDETGEGAEGPEGIVDDRGAA